jgi:hypothetical protein
MEGVKHEAEREAKRKAKSRTSKGEVQQELKNKFEGAQRLDLNSPAFAE